MHGNYSGVVCEASPIDLPSGDIVNENHLQKEAGGNSRVVMADTKTCEGTKVTVL